MLLRRASPRGAIAAALVLRVFGEGACAQSAPALPVPAEYRAGIRYAIALCAVTQASYQRTGLPRTGADLAIINGLAPIADAPYSAVALMESSASFADGNRIVHRESTAFYRDRQGRTRVEHTARAADHYHLPMPPLSIINDPVNGTCTVLDAPDKTAHVVAQRGTIPVIKPPADPGLPPARLTMPGLDFTGGVPFDLQGIFESPVAGTQASLGTQLLNGIPAHGTRVQHHIAAGAVGNEQTILINVENWFSPDLGVILRVTQRTSIGGAVDYHLEQITRAEPDPALFQVPPGYSSTHEAPAFGSIAIAAPSSSRPATPPAATPLQLQPPQPVQPPQPPRP